MLKPEGAVTDVRFSLTMYSLILVSSAGEIVTELVASGEVVDVTVVEV
jgi:hypothetical protein